MTQKGTYIMIMRKIQKVEDTLKDSMYKVDLLEKKLKTKQLTIESREQLETKLNEIKKVLKKNEEKLKRLRKQKSTLYMVAAGMVFACFLFYGLYVMIYLKI